MLSSPPEPNMLVMYPDGYGGQTAGYVLEKGKQRKRDVWEIFTWMGHEETFSTTDTVAESDLSPYSAKAWVKGNKDPNPIWTRAQGWLTVHKVKAKGVMASDDPYNDDYSEFVPWSAILPGPPPRDIRVKPVRPARKPGKKSRKKARRSRVPPVPAFRDEVIAEEYDPEGAAAYAEMAELEALDAEQIRSVPMSWISPGSVPEGAVVPSRGKKKRGGDSYRVCDQSGRCYITSGGVDTGKWFGGESKAKKYLQKKRR